MIQKTLDRLRPLARPEDVWVITNSLLDETIAQQLPEVPRENILSEPAARNTAPACALAAFLLEPNTPDAVIGIFPSDHVINNDERFVEVLRAAVELAASGEKIVVLGVPATRPETGYGYIEQGEVVREGSVPVRRVKRFTEKPNLQRAEEFLAAGNYAWNGGIFLWTARTLANAIREHCPAMAPLLEKIAATHGTPEFEQVFAELYPQCENISIDYAVLEPRSAKGETKSEIYCLPADFAWNDIGCWGSLHEHLTEGTMQNKIDATDPVHCTIDSERNYVYAPGKVVALVGVNDLVVVDTGDCLLITARERSQDVGKVVSELKKCGRQGLV
jgi:mannose-1-phosphate guanylyltransferase